MNAVLIRKSNTCTSRWLGGFVFAAILVGVCLTACSNHPNNGMDNRPVRMDLDLNQVVLGPKDVSDLFQGATYSISQAITTPQSRGESVTYPTQMLLHTTAFANGFLTRIEIFKNVDQAMKSYNILLTQQGGENLAMNSLGNGSQAFKRPVITPEGFELDSTEYAILFRDRNAVVTIILRTDKAVSTTRLGELAGLIIERLQP